MLRPVTEDSTLQFAFQELKIIVHPSLALRFNLFEFVEFYFVLACMDELLLYVVSLCKLFEPHRSPDVSNVTHQGHRTYFKPNFT